MDLFQIGFVEALYKVIEDRIPGGRHITTLTSVLVVATIIIFCADYLFHALYHTTARTAELFSLLVAAIQSQQPLSFVWHQIGKVSSYQLAVWVFQLALMMFFSWLAVSAFRQSRALRREKVDVFRQIEEIRTRYEELYRGLQAGVALKERMDQAEVKMSVHTNRGLAARLLALRRVIAR